VRGFYSYKAAATPGTLAALALALERYGTKTLAEVLAPAIAIAEYGAPFTPAQQAFLRYYSAKVRRSPYLSRLFLRDGIDLWDVDHVYCNPDLACLLRRIGERGAADFYHGGIAAEIVADMTAQGGWLREGDLEMMEAQERKPISGRYRDLEVLSFPFPGGGATVLETLGILDRFPPELLREDSVDRLHLLIEAGRIAFADTFPARRPARLPDEAATDPDFLARRAAIIRFDRALYANEVSAGPLSTVVVDGTSQVSTADAAGNAVALTQTLGATFGSGAAPEGMGFALNSLMNGFDFRNPRLWAYLAPLQPPMNSMAPTIVLAGGKPLLVLGSAGSARISPLIVSTIVGVVDRRRPLCEAMAAPRALWGGNVETFTYLELVDPITVEQADALQARGFTEHRLTYPASPLVLTDFGGVNAIFIDPSDGTFVGVGDPRRQAVAAAPAESAVDATDLLVPECWRSLGATP
jgi:gamma-glutamyltranspeptidase/glutathione hydrolase